MFAYISVTLGDTPPRLSSFYLSTKVWYLCLGFPIPLSFSHLLYTGILNCLSVLNTHMPCISANMC